MTIFTRDDAPRITNAGTYAHLRALPPEAYLRPENFITAWSGDKDRALCAKRYQEGLALGTQIRCFNVCANGTWSADMLDGGYMSSYEGIGYHAGSSEFLRGILDSGVTVRIYRDSRIGRDGENGVLIQIRKCVCGAELHDNVRTCRDCAEQNCP